MALISPITFQTVMLAPLMLKVWLLPCLNPSSMPFWVKGLANAFMRSSPLGKLPIP